MTITALSLTNGDIVRDGNLTGAQPRTVHAVLDHDGVVEIIWEDGLRSTRQSNYVPSIVERDGVWIDQIGTYGWKLTNR